MNNVINFKTYFLEVIPDFSSEEKEFVQDCDDRSSNNDDEETFVHENPFVDDGDVTVGSVRPFNHDDDDNP